MVFNPVNNFPKEYARVAKLIYDKLESERWGEDEVEAEDGPEDGEEDGEEDGTPTGNTANGSGSMSYFKPSTSASKGIITDKKEKRVRVNDSDYPHDTDPIFGLTGIMHHILRIKREKMTAYQISPLYKSKNAKVFGHNGLEVGTCWPNQMALLRDGAHG
jgi:hypothetical protein